MMKGYIIAAAVIAAGFLVCCAKKDKSHESDRVKKTYTQISQEEAMQMIGQDDGHIIVDVRRQDEFDTGHIPGAVCIPNESICDTQLKLLPDKDQIILVYCRSGNRSKQASQKLADMGYTHVYEFGGIIDWTGEIVTDEGSVQPAQLSFESFDGGGYDYSISLKDDQLVSYIKKHIYRDPYHDMQTGSAYNVVFTFTGLRPGETDMTVTAVSPIIPEETYSYRVKVNEDLTVEILQSDSESNDVTNTEITQ